MPDAFELRCMRAFLFLAGIRRAIDDDAIECAIRLLQAMSRQPM